MQFTKYLCPNTVVHVVHSVLSFAPPCGLIIELCVAYRCWPDRQGTIIPCISRLEEDRTSNARSTISMLLLCHLSITHGTPLKQGSSLKETPSWEKRVNESKMFREVQARKVVLWEVSILPERLERWSKRRDCESKLTGRNLVCLSWRGWWRDRWELRGEQCLEDRQEDLERWLLLLWGHF